jgi:hypothetical protein
LEVPYKKIFLVQQVKPGTIFIDRVDGLSKNIDDIRMLVSKIEKKK